MPGRFIHRIGLPQIDAYLRNLVNADEAPGRCIAVRRTHPAVPHLEASFVYDLQTCSMFSRVTAVGSPLFGAVLDSLRGDWFMSSVMVQVPILIVGVIFATLVKPVMTSPTPPRASSS